MLYGACRVRPEELIIVGVSGGIDSVFLLTQLHKLGQPLTAAVFDHGLRPEAAEECAFVRTFCAEHGIPCVQGSGDVRAAAGGKGIEETARELRYRFLFGLAEERHAAAVAVAHHANDQAETVLLHLLRGSGTDGLCGMRPRTLPNAFSDSVPLIRPLLGITREEIETAVREEGLPFREDRSNNDPEYTRNRIRLGLIPALEKDYNPQIVPALCRLAETAAADREILEDILTAAVKRTSLRFSDAGAEWDRKAYLNEHYAVRMRLLKMAIAGIDPLSPDISFLNLKKADDFLITARENQTVSFFGGFWLVCEGDTASILKFINKISQKYPQMSGGWELSTETHSITTDELPAWIEAARAHPGTAVIDTAGLASEPFLRTAMSGERFQPYGNGGKNTKLSDFLINNKVPKQYRADLALAADAGGIIWIPGMRVSERTALRDGTREIMILRLIHNN